MAADPTGAGYVSALTAEVPIRQADQKQTTYRRPVRQVHQYKTRHRGGRGRLAVPVVLHMQPGHRSCPRELANGHHRYESVPPRTSACPITNHPHGMFRHCHRQQQRHYGLLQRQGCRLLGWQSCHVSSANDDAVWGSDHAVHRYHLRWPSWVVPLQRPTRLSVTLSWVPLTAV